MRGFLAKMFFNGASAEFHDFFERHYAELSRLAFLLTGEADAADDLAADAMLALWPWWDWMRGADDPVAYARGVVSNMARNRTARVIREWGRMRLLGAGRSERTDQPDLAAGLDVRAALDRLPFRKRVCVVLRHAFDLSEKETAQGAGHIGRTWLTAPSSDYTITVTPADVVHGVPVDSEPRPDGPGGAAVVRRAVQPQHRQARREQGHLPRRGPCGWPHCRGPWRIHVRG